MSNTTKAVDLLQQARELVLKLDDPKNTYALHNIQRAVDSLLRHNFKCNDGVGWLGEDTTRRRQ